MNERPVTSEVNFPYKEDGAGSIPVAPTQISDSDGPISTGSESPLRISERRESGRSTEVRFTAYQSGDAFTVWDHYTDTLVDDQMPCLESAEMLARLLTD